MADDNRTANAVLREWEKLSKVRGQLVRAGLLNGDATPQDVIECLRKQIPADLFAKPPAGA